MIASNYRKHVDALVRQMELDLSGVVTERGEQRAAAWDWLMHNGKTQTLKKPAVPNWFKSIKAAAQRLAKAIKDALLPLFLVNC